MPSSYSVLEDISDNTPSGRAVETEGGADGEVLLSRQCQACLQRLLVVTEEGTETKETGDEKMETDEKAGSEVSGGCD